MHIIIFLKLVYPWLEKITPLIYKKSIRIITIFLAVFMTFDITISCLAANRQEERHKNIPANSSLDEFLDNTYPDELLDRIYNNKKDM